MYTLSKHNFRKIHQSNILRDIIQILKHWIKPGKSCQRNLSWNFPTLFENVYGNLINFLLEFVSQKCKINGILCCNDISFENRFYFQR